jgi:hypothetical protein
MRVERKALLTLVIAFFAISYFFVGQTHQTQMARAQDEGDAVSDNTVPSGIESGALEVLREMSDTLSSRQKFSFDAEVSYDELLNSGQMIKLGGTIKITVKRPDKVYAEFSGDEVQRKAWYDGKELTVLNEKKDFYGTIDTPGTIDGTLDYLMESYDFTLPLADIMHTDPYGSFSDGAVEGLMVSDSIVRGKECSHLAFVGELIDWQLWVSTKKPALPCKLVITYKSVEGVPQYQAVFSKWNLEPKVPNSLFKPDLPNDAVKIDFIDEKKHRGDK